MKIGLGVVAPAVVLLLGSTPAVADDLTGADRLLCSVVEATLCTMEATCETAPPWRFNIPNFIEVDMKARLLKTTAASAENRQTPILNLSRADGLIVIQGLENERAFSFNIDELSGALTAAVARPGVFVGAFGACTPLTTGK